MRFDQIDKLRGWRPVNCHEMVLGVVPEQPGSSFENVLVVLDQTFGARVRLANLALRAIVGEEPVITQRVRVLLPGDPDALRCLLLEPLQLSRSNGHVCADLKSCHDSSFGVAVAPFAARKGPNEHTYPRAR